MKYAVRYYSRSGKTKQVAEVIARTLGVEAESVDSAKGHVSEHVDVLFVGGALYAYGLDKNLDTWLDKLDPALVGKAVAFSTSWISKHALQLIHKKLDAKGIQVASDDLYLKSGAVDSSTERIERFAEAHRA